MKPCFIEMTVFTTALCNLNCKYCYICKDKAGGLQYIDERIAKDFEEGNQIKNVLNFDPNIKDTLRSICLWGGEPFLHIERFLDHIEEYFEAFPNLDEIGTSTNLTIPNQCALVQQLIYKIEKLYKGTKPFKISLQVSIDGYPEMNDAGRGEGVTKRFLQNFNDLCNFLEYDSNKIFLEIFTKPTLSKDTFKFLETKEQCFKWFNFFDKEMAKVHDEHNCKWTYGSSLFNCASPTEWTKEDGIRYAHITNNIYSIQEKVKKECPSWSDFDSLIPEVQVMSGMLMDTKYKKENYLSCCRGGRCGGGCGSFIYTIVPITDGKFTMCHRGLFDAYTDYFNNVTNKDFMNGLSATYFKAQNVADWIYTPEQLKVLNNTIKKLDLGNNQIFYTDLVNDIREYAFAGIIDEKYTDVSEIEKTLGYFLGNSLCLQDGYIFTGSWVGKAPNELPLLYNGTMDIVAKEFDRILEEKGQSQYDLSTAIR